jgi:hypothetical protein
MFKEVDLRANPINCAVISKNAKIKSDCIFGNIVTSKSESPVSTTRVVMSIGTIVPVTTADSRIVTLLPVTTPKSNHLIDYKIPGTSRKSDKLYEDIFAVTTLKAEHQYPVKDVVARKEEQTTLQTTPINQEIGKFVNKDTDKISITESDTSTFTFVKSMNPEAKMSAELSDSSVEFYIRITLGPIGVMYLIASLAVIIRQYLSSRNRQRMGV